MYRGFIYGSDDISFPSYELYEKNYRKNEIDCFELFIELLKENEIHVQSMSISIENKCVDVWLEKAIDDDLEQKMIWSINEFLKIDWNEHAEPTISWADM